MKREALEAIGALRPTLTCLVIAAVSVTGVNGQSPVDSEVRQIVTFSFLPGRSGEAAEAYGNQVIPLYEKNAAMLSFRGFREVESPIPLDLMVVSAFNGMEGMDASNSMLRRLAAEAGTSIGALYGALGALSTRHTDQFVEMLPRLGNGDPSARRLTAFVWYRTVAGEGDAFEEAVGGGVAPWEEMVGVPSSTGRFLISDGWHYLRLLGFDSLAEYQDYWSRVAERPAHIDIVRLTAERREVIVASIPEFAVR